MTVTLQGPGPILIVDDSRHSLRIAEVVFEDSQVKNEVVFLESGEALLAYLNNAEKEAQQPPSMVLLDINMPGPDGFDLLKEIRSRSLFQSTPVIMLSCSNDHRDMQRALDGGANAYQVKPFGIEEFIEFANSLIPAQNAA